MQQEHEARFFDMDPDQIRRLLHGLNATCVSPRRMVRGVVMESEWTQARGGWVSLRTEGPHHVLSYRSGDGPDLEMTVSDFGVAERILEQLGLTVSRHQESHREEWRLNGLTYVLDEWPGLPACLEIGGPDPQTVRWAARQLGLDPTQAEAEAAQSESAPASSVVGGSGGAAVPPPVEEAVSFKVSDLGWSCSQNGWEPGLYRVEWAAVLDNPNLGHYCHQPTVHITARDENGQVVGAAEHTMPLLPPGGRLAWASWLETNGPPGSLEVKPRPADWRPTATPPERFPAFGYQSVRFVVRGRACSVTGEVVNPYPVRVGMIAITALFRDRSGRLVGGETAFAEGMPGHGSVPFKLDGEAPAGAGPVTSLDLVAVPWGADSDGPWEQILDRG